MLTSKLTSLSFALKDLTDEEHKLFTVLSGQCLAFYDSVLLKRKDLPPHNKIPKKNSSSWFFLINCSKHHAM